MSRRLERALAAALVGALLLLLGLKLATGSESHRSGKFGLFVAAVDGERVSFTPLYQVRVETVQIRGAAPHKSQYFGCYGSNRDSEPAELDCGSGGGFRIRAYTFQEMTR